MKNKTPAEGSEAEKPAAEAQKGVTPEDQKSRIETFQEKLNKVTEVYLIATSWWEHWCQYTSYGDEDKETAPKPGKIDNTELQSTEFTLALNPSLTEEVHYQYLTPLSWKALHEWYGIVDDNSIFKREQTFDKRGKARIELYPFIIDIKEYEEDGSIVHAKFEYFAADSTVETIFERLQTDHPDVVVRLRVPFRIANFNGDEYLEENIPADFDKETYVELTRESPIWNVPLNSFNVLKRTGEVFIFEYESEKGTRKFPSSKVFDFKKLTIGSVAIGHDQYGKWYHMHIQGLKTNKENKKQFLCHWLGFKATWNEWIECDEEDKYACIGGEKHKNVELKWYPSSTKKKAARVNMTTNRSVPSSNRSRTTGSSSTTKVSSSSRHNYTSSFYSHQEGKSVADGIVGLRNLGNTCFMNSVIQCFNQTPFIAEYFLKNEYQSHINKQNVLGHGGKVATQWAELMQAMWSKKYKVVVPLSFKKTIGEFAPQFMGYSQQDSQELLSFLLDGIHEDLNSVKTKPYFEKLEVGERPLSEVAETTWGHHLLRNKSIIVDNMHGLLKSRVECPECPRVSVTFDPYSTLSVPIPSQDTKVQILTHIPHRPPPDFVLESFGVKVKTRATIAQLKECFIKQRGLTDVETDNLVICNVQRGKFNKLQRNTDSVARMHNPTSDDFFVYELKPINRDEDTPKPEEYEEKLHTIDVCHRKPGSYDAYFGFPFPLVIDEGLPWTKQQLVGFILESIVPFLDPEIKERVLNEGFDFDHTQLFDIKYQEVQKTMRYRYTTHEFSDLEEDITIVGKIILYWKSLDPYDRKGESYMSRKRDPTCIQQKQAGVSLKNCFECFTDEEILQDDNLWYCSQCKVHRPAKKTMSIWTLPNILVVHLKRFQYTRWNRSKISSNVSFPIENLDLKPWVENPEVRAEDCVYDLFGVSNHSGNLGGGHYTAYVKNRLNAKWYNCNDATAREMSSSSSLCSPQSYLLFFCRRKSTPEGSRPTTTKGEN